MQSPSCGLCYRARDAEQSSELFWVQWTVPGPAHTNVCVECRARPAVCVLEREMRNSPVDCSGTRAYECMRGMQSPSLGLCVRKKDILLDILFLTTSARRDSNPRPPPWQGGAPPLSHSRIFKFLFLLSLSQQKV